MKAALAKYDSILREAIESNHGQIIKTTGDGVHAVFTTAIEGINAAIAAQHALLKTSEVLETSEVWPLRVRMGLHTGEAESRDGDYYGQALNRAARIMSIGHGGQVRVSGAIPTYGFTVTCITALSTRWSVLITCNCTAYKPLKLLVSHSASRPLFTGSLPSAT